MAKFGDLQGTQQPSRRTNVVSGRRWHFGLDSQRTSSGLVEEAPGGASTLTATSLGVGGVLESAPDWVEESERFDDRRCTASRVCLSDAIGRGPPGDSLLRRQLSRSPFGGISVAPGP